MGGAVRLVPRWQCLQMVFTSTALTVTCAECARGARASAWYCQVGTAYTGSASRGRAESF